MDTVGTTRTLVSLAEITAARDVLAGTVRRTPVLPLDIPGRSALSLKAEHLQLLGSFKIRGALNAVAALPQAIRARGLVAFSSGNHGKAVAYAARRFGVDATIVMPVGAPTVKITGVRALGATVELIEPALRDRYAHDLADRLGATLVYPFHTREAIAGQGTIGLEVLAQAPDVSVVLAPIGGGGLISGIATAVKATRPDVRVVGVEPEFAATATESLRTAERATWTEDRTYRTLADGLRAPALGELPWAHIQRFVDDVVTVSEADIGAAMRFITMTGKQVVEPSGAVAAAAVLSGKYTVPDDQVAVAVVSGGNVDAEVLGSVLATG